MTGQAASTVKRGCCRTSGSDDRIEPAVRGVRDRAEAAGALQKQLASRRQLDPRLLRRNSLHAQLGLKPAHVPESAG